MKTTAGLSSVLAVLFFIALSAPAHAGDESSKKIDVEKAVAAFEKKVQELKIKCTAPKKNSSAVTSTYGYVQPEVSREKPEYGSAYWGHMLDN